MLNHVMVGTRDLDKAKAFYNAVLGVLGVGEPVSNVAPSGKSRIFYMHDGCAFCVTEPINGEEATVANGGTIGFKCNSPEQVQRFHDVAVEQGGTSIEEPPGARNHNLGTLYLAYVRDLDGHKLCAIHRPQS